MENNIDYVKGVNGSYAKKVYNLDHSDYYWMVKGTELSTLSDTGEKCYGYRIDDEKVLNVLADMPDDTPIFSVMDKYPTTCEDKQLYNHDKVFLNSEKSLWSIKKYSLDTLDNLWNTCSIILNFAYSHSDNQDLYNSAILTDKKRLSKLARYLISLLDIEKNTGMESKILDISDEIKSAETNSNDHQFDYIFKSNHKQVIDISEKQMSLF